jgi:hypothetical protein
MCSLPLRNGIISFKNDDDYETPKYIWEMLDPYMDKNQTIYDPFYCSGLSKQYLNELGYNVIHNDEDFYENYDKHEYDIIVSNPPFSDKKKVFNKLKEIDKPFIMIVPVSTITKKFFRDKFKDDDISMLIPNGRLQFSKKGEQLSRCWFDCVFLCYKLNLDKQIIYLE